MIDLSGFWRPNLTQFDAKGGGKSNRPNLYPFHIRGYVFQTSFYLEIWSHIITTLIKVLLVITLWGGYTHDYGFQISIMTLIDY